MRSKITMIRLKDTRTRKTELMIINQMNVMRQDRDMASETVVCMDMVRTSEVLEVEVPEVLRMLFGNREGCQIEKDVEQRRTSNREGRRTEKDVEQ